MPIIYKKIDREENVFQDSQLDAFSRLRTSQPVSVFNSQNLYGLDDDIFESINFGVGASSTFLPNESSTALTVGTVDGEYAIKQTFRYFPYTPGKSQLITMTGVIGQGKTNVVKRLGYFDDGNGVFFEQNGNTLGISLRTSTSGTPVDAFIQQSAWNIDTFDGTGPSGITLDISKIQIFVIDFQWLGAGRVRYGFDVDGVLYYCHQTLNANNLDKVYMTTAVLPLRFEIRNIGIAASSSTLKAVCTSVCSEGGIIPEGEEFAASSGITSRSVTTRVPIMAIRMKGTINGKVNRRTAKILNTSFRVLTNDAYIEIIHGHTPSAITANWIDAGTDSGIQYSTDISAVTFAESHRMSAFFATAGKEVNGVVASQDATISNEHNYIYLNHAGTESTYVVIYATAFANPSSIASAISWIEY
jgi:hypothetical protein